MDPSVELANLLIAMGYGSYVPLALFVVGVFSAIATRYQPTWPGAKYVHVLALMVGNAKPAIPATPVTSTGN